MKLELCKFYLMDCCAKGDKCSYMHSEFPCKFYHAGLSCAQGENCKFAHGKPLSDGMYKDFKNITDSLNFTCDNCPHSSIFLYNCLDYILPNYIILIL